MNFYLAVTDINWYNYLSKINPEDINFWQPGGRTNFRILSPGEPFLFKLKVHNVIGGVGFFFKQIFLPLSLAWETFGERNGFDTLSQFQRAIMNLRKDKEDTNPQIGCLVLTNPVFFNSKDWIPLPEDWKSNIVQGKTYNTNESIGKACWERVEILLKEYLKDVPVNDSSCLVTQVPDSPIYGNPVLTKVRIGQGAFKISIIDAYNKRCSISGERTMPVLEAAHIKPYSEAGPNFIKNGLLLRSDIHKLFDSGYITITSDHKIEISNRIREEFENGREYYQYHGKDLSILPSRNEDRPFKDYIEWHNENVYRG
jgi:putative restriction endonuclease